MAMKYSSVSHCSKEGVYVQDGMVPEGVREGLTRETYGLELELEGCGQLSKIHVKRGSPSREQLYNITKAGHIMEQSLVTVDMFQPH